MPTDVYYIHELMNLDKLKDTTDMEIKHDMNFKNKITKNVVLINLGPYKKSYYFNSEFLKDKKALLIFIE